MTATTAYAVGPNTLLQTTDAGETWPRRGAGTAVTSPASAARRATLCLMTTAARHAPAAHRERRRHGRRRSRPSTQALFAAGFETSTRAVAAGVGGATVVSDDGGRNYRSIGGDIGGSFQFGLRLGPAPMIAFALGARGQLARTTTAASPGVRSASRRRPTCRTRRSPPPAEGYALDSRGGLFRTQDGGQSWSDARPRHDRRAEGGDHGGPFVLLAGPRGDPPRHRRRALRRRRQPGGARRRGDRFDRAGATVFAFGSTTDRPLERPRAHLDRDAAARVARPRQDVPCRTAPTSR